MIHLEYHINTATHLTNEGGQTSVHPKSKLVDAESLCPSLLTICKPEIFIAHDNSTARFPRRFSGRFFDAYKLTLSSPSIRQIHISRGSL